MNKKRESNIELLRIVAMFLIISFHYVYKSGYVFQELNFNSFIVKFFYFFGELGVNLFILITGYFLVNGKFSFKKLIKLVIEVIFYTVLLSIVSVLIKHNANETMGWYQAIKDGIITFFTKYWFSMAYILLYIISPYLNIIIQNLKKNDYKKLLLIVLFLWSVIPTIFGLLFNSTETLLFFNRFVWMIIVYFIGAYIRLYSIKFMEKRKRAIITALISLGVMISGIFIIYRFKGVFEKIGTSEVAYFWTPNAIPMVFLSVAIFKIFEGLKVNYNKFINVIASTTFGVYMLHDGILDTYIWNDIFKAKLYLSKPYSVLCILVSAVIVFAVGAVVDLIRQFIEKYTVSKFLDSKVYDNMRNKTKKALKRLMENV